MLNIVLILATLLGLALVCVGWPINLIGAALVSIGGCSLMFRLMMGLDITEEDL